MKNIFFCKSYISSLLIVCFFILASEIKGQVTTRFLKSKDDIYLYAPWHIDKSPLPIVIPTIGAKEIEDTINKDKINGILETRIGINQSVLLNVNDGVFYDYHSYSIWKMKVVLKRAKYLCFKFENLELPYLSQMIIYNENTKILYGPIQKKNVHDGKYMSDMIYGDSATIEVFLPTKVKNQFNLSLKRITQGIKIQNSSRDFGDSLPCNINSDCADASWAPEISATCMLLTNGVFTASATLLNNECNDFTPYILGANHTVILYWWLEDYSFRFKWESSDCEENVYNENYVTYFDGEVIARWTGSDYILFELMDEIADPSISFAGWDRSENIPTSSFLIHHPQTDVKKITIDAQPCYIEHSPPSDLGTLPDDMFLLYFGQQGDMGTTEDGSSGGGHFNQDHRLVGHISGAHPVNINCSNHPLENQWTGRFFADWAGVMPFLGANTNPVTVNTISRPVIKGDNILCTNPKTYILNNPTPGYTITWAVSPTSLFGSSTSGTGTQAILWGANSTSKGNSILTFTLYSEACGTVTYSKNIWIGKPSFQIFIVDSILCIGDETVATIGGISPLNNSTFEWAFDGSISGTAHGVHAIIDAISFGIGHICIKVTNECGMTELCTLVSVQHCERNSEVANDISDKIIADFDDSAFDVYPNPTQDRIMVTLKQKNTELNDKCLIQILNTNGNTLYKAILDTNTQTIDTHMYTPGVYYLKLIQGQHIAVKKFIIM